MLRLQYEGSAEKLSCMHDTEHSQPANSLHRLGQKLLVYVWHCPSSHTTFLISNREIFGTSEDEAPELDHSEDSDNRKIKLLNRLGIF